MRTISPRRTPSPNGKSESGLGKYADSAASASGLVGVKADKCTSPSTILSTVVDSPCTSWFDRSAIAWNTGCTSSGELAMTLRISAVAVWRSSASRRRLFSLAVSDLGLSARRSPDFVLRDLGRVDWGLRVDLAR